VSIFVNPTQFAPSEDFSKYPRTFAADRAALATVAADLVYAPTVAEMYPDGFALTLVPGGPATVGLEDRFRPTHFQGVATIVAKLFTQAGPDVAAFGEKDYQQLAVVWHLVRDLDLPVRIVGVETVRETDGLAMSSRNRYLAPADRGTAALIPAVLGDVAAAIRAGAAPKRACSGGVRRLTKAGFAVDYLEARDARTLAPARRGGGLRLLVAARLGATRLIDNIAV
jgi:pantoate--beta-alanine ligase